MICTEQYDENMTAVDELIALAKDRIEIIEAEFGVGESFDEVLADPRSARYAEAIRIVEMERELKGPCPKDELIRMLAEARREGIYEDDPRWAPIDESLKSLGYPLD